MEKKRKTRGKWLLALGALLMAAGLCMLALQPSVLQYCIVAPTDEAAPEPSGQAEQTAQQEESGALQKLCEAWQTRVGGRPLRSPFGGLHRRAGLRLRPLRRGRQRHGDVDGGGRKLVFGLPALPRLRPADDSSRNCKDGDRLIVLDEPLAFKLFPTADPIGRELTIGTERYEVIGVVRYRRSVGEYEQYQAYIPYTSAAEDRLPMEIVEVCGAALPQSGASRAFEDAGENWQAGGTFIDTDKEAMRGGIVARALAIALGLYLILYLLRRLNRRTAGVGVDIRARLQTEYFRDMLPGLLPRSGLLALGYAALLAAAYGVLTLAIEPMYVFTEWIPDVLVELSSITERFWQLTSAAAAPIVIRTQEYAEIRFWSGLVRWGAISALTGALVMALSARRGKRQEQRITTKQRREASLPPAVNRILALTAPPPSARVFLPPSLPRAICAGRRCSARRRRCSCTSPASKAGRRTPPPRARRIPSGRAT